MDAAVNPEPLAWLLERAEPSARYRALRGLLDRPEEDPDVIEARAAIARSAPVRAILDAQYPAGYWMRPDQGYSPRYKATTWQILFLADLGVARDEHIARACEHVLATTFRPDYGLFCAYKHSTGLFPCLNGDMLRALQHFGYAGHPAVGVAGETLARRILREGWICVRNGTRPRDRRTWLPCIWGCVRVLRGFAGIPEARRGPDVRQAIESGLAFLLSHDLAQDQRPTLVKDPSHWLRLGFPLGYGSDLLEALLALAELDEARPSPAVRAALARALLAKRNDRGRWPLEYTPRNTWADFGVEGEPSRQVTLRALEVLGWLDRS
jgi:hypothetical protein